MISGAVTNLDTAGAGEAPDADIREPQVILAWALERFSARRIAFCTSFQVDGMAIIDMAWRMDRSLRVVTIDTGRLPAETYEMIDRVRERYGIEVEVTFPRAEDVEPLIQQHGANLFYESEALRGACCEVRKARPLARLLGDFDAWVTGLRRDQAASRTDVSIVEPDLEHGGKTKLNPLAYWTEAQVWEYVREHQVPIHPLYAQGYASIGCAPCTRPITLGEDARAGRWWWEQSELKECGIHFQAGPNGELVTSRLKVSSP
ncbi:MAG: phosphoadenylyl-sulfate reductase [Chloroflexota bacterium]